MNISDMNKIQIPLVKKIYPQLIANKLVSVQPLSGPTSLIYYLRHRYNSTRISNTRFGSIRRRVTQRRIKQFIEKSNIKVKENSFGISVKIKNENHYLNVRPSFLSDDKIFMFLTEIENGRQVELVGTLPKND